MARRLGQDTNNEMPINDPISGSKILFFYRMPTNQERIRYQAALVSVKGFRVRINNAFENRLKHGMAIITGFRDGDFEILRNGQWTGISSNPESPLYFADWQAFLRETAGDLVVALSQTVFEGATAVRDEDEDEDEDKAMTPEDAVVGEAPTGKNSRKSSLGILMSDD